MPEQPADSTISPSIQSAATPPQHSPNSTTSLSEKYRIYRPSELKARVKQLGKSGYIVDGLIPQQALVLMVGDSGLGKSPLLYQAAACIAEI